jgi:putative aldouronate transport system permease protein
LDPVNKSFWARRAVAFTKFLRSVRRSVRRDWQLYVLLLPAIALVFIFSYLPMYGIQIVFRDFKAAFGITGSEWVGLKNFIDFFNSYYSWRLIGNTLLLNVFGLLWAFPIPIIMAILLNQIELRRFKRFTQTAIYAPHFISSVVLVGMLMLFLSPSSGIVNTLIKSFGGQSYNFMVDLTWFRTLFISSDVWQHAGWNTILYIAALTAIDPGLYEAATIDGATKTQKIRYIDVPHLVPIIVMLLILNCGAMLVSSTDKALLMQNSGNMPRSDIIGTYVYRMGLRGGQFSYTAAINLFVNLINFTLILSVNWVSKKMNQAGLF